MKKLAAFLILLLILLAASPAAVYGSADSIELTAAEIAFIIEHPVIRLGVDPAFVPFEFIDNNSEYKGITADYLELLSEATGLKFEVEYGLSWQEAYDKALTSELDALPAVSKTPERQEHFLFTEAYYYFKRVIVTREDDQSITGLEDLEDFAAAVQRNSSHHSYLLSHPKINLSLYDSVESALTAVASGSERAFVGNLATTNYIIKANGMTNLKFTAFEAEQQQGIHIAVRRDWPELVSILNKALLTISTEERIAINNKWIGIEQKPDYGPLIRIFSLIGGLAAVVIMVSLYWVFRLRKEIKKRYQIQLALEKAKLEADEANQFKSNFMARMSHEIRTPLNAITGLSYLMKNTELSETQRTYQNRISQAAVNMLNIVNDILDFAKIEAGKVELEIISFNLSQVIDDVIGIVSYKIEEQKIGLRLTTDPLLPGWFFGDPKRIEQILLNLLNNAAKFTSEGEISLDVRLAAQENDICHLVFTVRDTGIGMSQDQVKKLFDPFTQGDSSINRRFGGSGLGLSIVSNLVEMMNGEIQVYSTEGIGSTFIINLALQVDKSHHDTGSKSGSGRSEIQTSSQSGQIANQNNPSNVNQKNPAAVLPAASVSTEADLKQPLVLVAEDNKTNQLIAKALLEQAGMKVIIADDGKEAVERFSRQGDQIDLILMDLHMPVLNGYEAAGKIRESSEAVPIVAMTADVIEGVREKCAASGIHDYISKPFEPERFIQTVRDLIQRSKTAEKTADVLDQAAGLRSIGGSHELYLQVLGQYYQENQETLAFLRRSIDAKMYEEAARLVHKIKSSSGSIGAKRLHDTSAALQKALFDKDQEQISLLLDRFSQYLVRVLEEISTAISRE